MDDPDMSKIAEIRQYLEINGEPDVTEADAIEYAMGECGMTSDGYCMLAGTEHCDFECPFR